MKKIIILWLLGCLLITALFPLQPAAAEDSGKAQISYYKDDFQIYTLQTGNILVHADLYNLKDRSVTLVAELVKDGAVIASSQASKTAAADTDYIAAEIAVSDDTCQLQAKIQDAAGNVLYTAPVFKKESTVIVPDPGKITEPLSETISITAGGKTIPVRREELKGMDEGGARDKPSSYIHVAKFCLKTDQEITIELHGINGTVLSDGWWVSPQELSIPHTISKGVGYIFIDKPQVIYIRNWAINSGSGYEDIVLLITPLETDVPYKYGDNITYYADGVKTCPANPSFTENEIVYFETGYHAGIGTLSLKPGMRVYLAPGAVLEAKIETKDVTENPDGIRIYGRGILECRSSTNTGNIKGIYFENCKNVQIEGIGTRNAREWQTLYVNCSDFVIEYFNTMGILLNNDGIDIDGVDHFEINNNFILSADDCFGWHGTDYEKIATPEHPYGRPTYAISAQNNVMYNLEGNAVRIGSSMEQEAMYDIFIKDTYVLQKAAYGFAITVNDWAAVSDVTVENFFVEKSISTYNGNILIDVVQGSTSRGNENKPMPEGLPSPVGSVDGVTIRNFKAPWAGTQPPIRVGAYDENHTVTGIQLQDVIMQTGTPIYTGGAGTAPITSDSIYKAPSSEYEDEVFVKDSDIQILTTPAN